MGILFPLPFALFLGLPGAEQLSEKISPVEILNFPPPHFSYNFGFDLLPTGEDHPLLERGEDGFFGSLLFGSHLSDFEICGGYIRHSI